MTRSMRSKVWKRRRNLGDAGDTVAPELFENLWGLYPAQHALIGPRFNAYSDHYNSLSLLASPLNAFRDHRAVVGLVNTVRERSADSIEDILSAIKQASTQWTASKTPFDDDDAEQAIHFATKLWLFSSPDLDEKTQSLDQANGQYYVRLKESCSGTHRSTVSTIRNGHLSSDFNAKSLTRKGGFYLIWTSSLHEHLTFASKDQLRVFRHAHVLQHHQRGKESTLFPPGFLDETYRTIHLLFPFEDLKTSRRVRRIARRERVDIEAAALTANANTEGMIAEKAMEEHEKFQLASYRYYAERLAEVQRRYDLARPRSLTQWWYDRRQRPEWAALVIALVVFLLTVLFGIAQTVTGILQVVASWH